MSIAAVVDEPQVKPRFLHLVEAPRLPYPIRPIKPTEWTPPKAQAAWARMCSHPFMLSDLAKRQFDLLMKGTLGGQIHWFDLGDGHGLIHVFGITEEKVGTINIELSHTKRSFFRKFGRAKECRSIWVESIFRWLKLRKLRAYIAEPNKASWKLAERAGFKLEGVLRDEWVVEGKPTNVRVYGILATEVM